MDAHRFDELTRLLGVSLTRKRSLAFLASALLAPMLAAAPETIVAKPRRRRKRRPGYGGVAAQGGEICGTPCETANDCGSCDAAVCFNPDEQNGLLIEGINGATGVCLSECDSLCFSDEDCAGLPGTCNCFEEHCLCDQVCGNSCGGACFSDGDCADSPGCVCTVNNPARVGAEGAGQCVTVCAGSCLKDADCADTPDCACLIPTGQTTGACGQPEQCPGDCADNAECREQGQGPCVCFLGVDTVNEEVVAKVVAEGNGGLCGECRGNGRSCDASTECCGQLVCRNGACARKRKPRSKKRCAKHGRKCTQDAGCCGQAICYRGKCGEKDTHCDSDRECARGYTCVGGRLTGGHRRCRRQGRRRPRRRRNRG
ncbi:MAG: hypothetical protein K0Q71_2544 [Thermomicrobiales bacterium]|jgi:hypothetical protein|nr:hypothetical protein [Thermomicrobiales bacterium]